MIPKVAIIILNWNQAKLSTDTLDSFLKISSTNFNWHIFLVDNHSTDDSLKTLQKKFSKNKKITFIKSSHNLGYTGGNNLGIKRALKEKYTHLLIANNDILVKSNFLTKLIAAAKTYPQAILAPKIYFAPGFEYHSERYKASERGKVIWAFGGKFDWQNIYGSNFGIDEVDSGQYDKAEIKLDFISGCCFLAPASLFKKISFFDNRYYLYLEDVDFTHRAALAGYTLKIIPDSHIWHLNSGSSKPGSDIQEYFITRNRLLFASKFASSKTKFALFRESLRFLFSSSLWRRRGVIDFYFKKLGRGSWQ